MIAILMQRINENVIHVQISHLALTLGQQQCTNGVILYAINKVKHH